jgi:hypothetical protein
MNYVAREDMLKLVHLAVMFNGSKLFPLHADEPEIGDND